MEPADPVDAQARPRKTGKKYSLFVKFSAVDDYENFGQKRTLKKYGMDRNTLYLWRKQKEDEEKGWASKDDFTCPMCGTPLLMGESWLQHLEACHLMEDGVCRVCNMGANETHSILHIWENKYMEAKEKGR